MKRYMAIFILLLSSCKEESATSSDKAVSSTSCKGIYYVRDAYGELKKYNQYWLESAAACFTDNMELSQWEKTSEAWNKNNIQCTPQPQFSPRSVIADNNFYDYRDGKVYINFNSATGVYKKIILGEDRNGNPTFSRLQGCFYQRTGSGVDVAFGKQLLLDTYSPKIASSEYFDPMEIFRYDESPTTLNMTRFDSSSDWDFTFCPDINTPWKFCELLRDGNIMYWPTNLTNTQKDDLKNEALLIRTQFNYSVISDSVFENLWSNVDKTRKEIGRGDWKYKTVHLPDTPLFIDAAWRDYIIGNRPTMPNVNSNTMPTLCYSGSQTVTLSNGNVGRVYGQICYTNGIYTFQPE